MRIDCLTSREPAGLCLALCRGVLYESLALVFRPPYEGMVFLRAGAPQAIALPEAAAWLDRRLTTALENPARRLAGHPLLGDTAARARAYESLFGHTGRGPIPPYETEYGDDTLFQKPQEMGDVAAFLRAFGLALDPAARERIDHLSCELEFMAFLMRKEAHALQTGDGAMLGGTVAAERAFVRDHAGRFAPAFARRVVAADPEGLYGAAAALLLELFASEGRRLGVPLGPASLRLRDPIDDNAPMACGDAAGCAPGPCGPEPEE
jgi:TorA maturation chaperone TorD